MAKNIHLELKFWHILGGLIYLQLPLIFFSLAIADGFQILLWVLWCAILLWGASILWRNLQTNSQMMTSQTSMSNGDYQRIFKNSPLPMFVLSEDLTRVVAINDVAVKTTKYNHNEVLATEEVVQEVWNEFENRDALLTQLKETGRLYNLETSITDKFGKVHDLLVFVKRVELAQSHGYVVYSVNVTEAKQTRKRLQQTRHELDTIVRVFPDLFVRIDADGKIFDYMSGDMPAFGIPPERFLGQMLEDILPNEPANVFSKAISRALENQELQSIEYPLDINGITHYFEMRLFPEDDGCVLCIGRDITERKRAERDLKESEEKFRQLAENFNGVLLIRDLKTRSLLYISPSFFTFWGDDPQNAMLNSFSIINAVHPDDRLIARDSFAKQKQGKACTAEYRVIGKDNALRWVQSRHILIENDDGEVYRVAVLIEDITERKKAENALRESQQIFDQLAGNINEVLFVREIDPAKLIYISPRCKEIWQLDAQTILADNEVIFNQAHKDDLPKIHQTLAQRQLGNAGEIKYRICRPDGTERWIHSKVFPIHDENGTIYRLAGVVADITEQVEQQDIMLETEHLRAELEKERELNVLIERFVSMASHEFRTPLTVIQSSSEMMERYAERMTHEQRTAHLTKITTQVGHMVGMLEDVLELGFGKSDKFKFNPETLDLHAVCEELLEDFAVTDDRNQPIIFKHPDDIDQVTMDKRLLTHILRNLISNARKYSDEGQSVHFDLQIEDKNAVFIVRDEGIGIPESAQSRLFEPFQRANNVGNKRGSGLGLAIAKNSVDVHGGTIEFTSTEGVGTTFTVRLPMRFYDLTFENHDD